MRSRTVLLAIGIMALVLAGFFYYQSTKVAPNPDLNHTHADFAVWVNGTRLDFSDEHYMSGTSTDESTHSHEGDRRYLHLHDGNDDVIHRHKPGLTLGDFLVSIGLSATDACLTLDQEQFQKLDPAWVSDFAVTPQLCNTGKFHWTMVVNAQARELDPSYVFIDGDQLLLSYSASDTAWEDQWETMTDDACKFSKTCPWRGAPPAENCIADPEVPCMVQ